VHYTNDHPTQGNFEATLASLSKSVLAGLLLSLPLIEQERIWNLQDWLDARSQVSFR
jgi:hypothetical protein